MFRSLNGCTTKISAINALVIITGCSGFPFGFFESLVNQFAGFAFLQGQMLRLRHHLFHF
jgi:hypothetical protein